MKLYSVNFLSHFVFQWQCKGKATKTSQMIKNWWNFSILFHFLKSRNDKAIFTCNLYFTIFPLHFLLEQCTVQNVKARGKEEVKVRNNEQNGQTLLDNWEWIPYHCKVRGSIIIPTFLGKYARVTKQYCYPYMLKMNTGL